MKGTEVECNSKECLCNKDGLCTRGYVKLKKGSNGFTECMSEIWGIYTIDPRE